MKIILKESVDGLGNIGEIVTVKPGYARNYLLPRDMAALASKSSVKELEHHKRQLDRKRVKLAQDSEAFKAKVEQITCTFELKAGEEGKLFGSVTAMDIAEKLASAGVEIDRKKLQLAEPIKLVGEYSVELKLQASIVASVKVVVKAEAE